MKLPSVILSERPPPTVPPDWTASVSLMSRAFSIFLISLSSGIRLLASILARIPCFSWMLFANALRSMPLASRALLMTPP